MDIISALEEDQITVKQVSSTNGGEYAGPCPFCGGTDRFRVWPEQGKGGRYWCRGCGKAGDAIQYLRDMRRLSYPDACRLLGLEPGMGNPHPRREEAQWEPREITPVSAEWQDKADAFVARAEGNLWSSAGEKALNWLKTERGLTKGMIRVLRLGWNPRDHYPQRKNWGLPEEMINGKPASYFQIPAGLVIPCLKGGQVVRIRIRRADPKADPRYWLVKGSDTSALILGDKKVVVLVESELDAILLYQKASDLVSVVALGNAQSRPDSKALEIINRAELVLVALDSDDAGAREAWTWWLKRFPQSRRWPVINGKDPTEAWRNGLDLRAWILAGMQEMQAVQTEEIHTAREKIRDEMRQLIADIDERQTNGDWHALRSIPSWCERLQGLVDAFGVAWQGGRNCRAEFEILLDHWRNGLDQITIHSA